MKKKLWMLTLIALTILASACGGGSSNGGDNQTQYPGQLPGSQEDGSDISAPNTRPTYLDTTTTGSVGSGPATLRVLLTDAPNPAIESAVVTIGEVTVHMTGGAWFSVLAEERTLDLLDLQNGVTSLLGEVELDAGKVTQIRMTVIGGEVIADGQSYDVEVPSGEIKLNRPFDVCAGGAIEVLIDFDAEKSLNYNRGKDNFKLQPVVKIESVEQDCPPEEDDSDESEYDGPLGWFSLVVPPVQADLFASLTTVIEDLQVHDQGIGQVSTLDESYEVDLLDPQRTILDEVTGEPIYTVLIPPMEIPAGDLDQIRLFFQSILATDNEGNTISIQLPPSEEGEGDGLKFFGDIPVCEDALTMLMWDLSLDAESLDFQNQTTVDLHPVIQEIHLIVTCEPLEDEEGNITTDDGDDDDSGDTGVANDDDDDDSDGTTVANDDDDDGDTGDSGDGNNEANNGQNNGRGGDK